MNTLIISTFSCTFEEFKNDVTNLFLEEMCKEWTKEAILKIVLERTVKESILEFIDGATKTFRFWWP